MAKMRAGMRQMKAGKLQWKKQRTIRTTVRTVWSTVRSGTTTVAAGAWAGAGAVGCPTTTTFCGFKGGVSNNWGEPERAPHDREDWRRDVQYIYLSYIVPQLLLFCANISTFHKTRDKTRDSHVDKTCT